MSENIANVNRIKIIQTNEKGATKYLLQKSIKKQQLKTNRIKTLPVPSRFLQAQFPNHRSKLDLQ